MLSWWVVSWLVGSGTLAQTNIQPREKKNAASWETRGAPQFQSSVPARIEGITNSTYPNGAGLSGPLNKQITTSGGRKKTNFRLPGVVSMAMVTA